MIRRIWSITLTVKNLKKAIYFYEKVLGLTKKYEYKDYAGFDCGGVEIGIKTWGELSPPRHGEPVINFLVDDIRKFCDVLKSQNVKILDGPKETLWGGIVMLFEDPDGNTLQATEINWKKYYMTASKG